MAFGPFFQPRNQGFFMRPKCLNQKAASVMDLLTQGLDSDNSSKTVDRSETFMKVHVELLYLSPAGPVYSVAHYYLQNGDLMSDPRMEFIKYDGHYFPSYFCQDGFLTHDEESIFFGKDGKLKVRPSMQSDQTYFANEWMLNIASQQLITV